MKQEKTNIDYHKLIEYRKTNDPTKSKLLKNKLTENGVKIFDLLAYHEIPDSTHPRTEIYFVTTTNLQKIVINNIL